MLFHFGTAESKSIVKAVFTFTSIRIKGVPGPIRAKMERSVERREEGSEKKSQDSREESRRAGRIMKEEST